MHRPCGRDDSRHRDAELPHAVNGWMTRAPAFPPSEPSVSSLEPRRQKTTKRDHQSMPSGVRGTLIRHHVRSVDIGSTASSDLGRANTNTPNAE